MAGKSNKGVCLMAHKVKRESGNGEGESSADRRASVSHDDSTGTRSGPGMTFTRPCILEIQRVLYCGHSSTLDGLCSVSLECPGRYLSYLQAVDRIP